MINNKKIISFILLFLLIILIIITIQNKKTLNEYFSSQDSDFTDILPGNIGEKQEVEIDENEYNGNGFNLYGYNINGYDIDGYNKDGFDKDGFDKEGYNKEGYHKDGYDTNGYNELGYDMYGYDRDGYNYYNRNSQMYNREGYDVKGYDVNGYDKEGYNNEGYNKHGYNKDGYDKNGYDIYGYNKDGVNRFGFNIKGERVYKDGEEVEENNMSQYFEDSEKTFNNQYPFSLMSDMFNDKIEKETNDTVTAFEKMNQYYRDELSRKTNSLYQNEMLMQDKYKDEIKRTQGNRKTYKCWLGNDKNILNNNSQYASYQKFDCSLSELFEKCQELEQEDKCLLYVSPVCIDKFNTEENRYIKDCNAPGEFVEVKKGEIATHNRVIEIDKDGNEKTEEVKLKCPDNFKCMNLPEEGGFACPGKEFTDSPMEPIKYSPEELQKYKDNDEGFPICEYPQKRTAVNQCYLGDNRNILNENPVFTPYIKYGCDLYKNYKKCMETGEGKYLVYDEFRKDVIEKDLEKNSEGKYILPNGLEYTKTKYCKSPPDIMGMSGFGCYTKDGKGTEPPIDPSKNDGKVCNNPVFNLSRKDINNIDIYNQEIETTRNKIDNTDDETEKADLENKIKEIQSKKDVLINKKKELLNNVLTFYKSLKTKYELYLEQANVKRENQKNKETVILRLKYINDEIEKYVKMLE